MDVDDGPWPEINSETGNLEAGDDPEDPTAATAAANDLVAEEAPHDVSDDRLKQMHDYYNRPNIIWKPDTSLIPQLHFSIKNIKNNIKSDPETHFNNIDIYERFFKQKK